MAHRCEGAGTEGQILIRSGHVTEVEVLKALAQQWGLCYFDNIPQAKLNKDLVANLPIEFLKKHKILPFNGSEDTVSVAVSDPLDLMSFDAVVKMLGVRCKRIICASSGRWERHFIMIQAHLSICSERAI